MNIIIIKYCFYYCSRIKLTNEMLSGMKVVKLNAWEEPLAKRIANIRGKEISILRYLAYLFGLTNFTIALNPFMISLTVFGLYTVINPNESLTADKIFLTITLFNLLKMPLAELPWSMVNLVKTIVSVNRIQKFLNCNEINPSAISDRMENDTNIIEMRNASFMLEEKTAEDGQRENEEENGSNPFYLQKVDLSVEKGSFVVIVGRVGSGKSTLLESILGEAPLIEGRYSLMENVRTAYVPQTAWIQNMTLKDNILFKNEENSSVYKTVLNACCLLPDLESLAAGDCTEIGEEGINLSGGQKHRVSLARAVMDDADLYLLDDPLSAVDAHVGKHIFDHVISSEGGLLKDKTIVMATNQVWCMKQADKIVVLDKGQISEIGTYEELMANNDDFAKFVTQYGASLPVNMTEKTSMNNYYKKSRSISPSKPSSTSPRTGSLLSQSQGRAMDEISNGSSNADNESDHLKSAVAHRTSIDKQDERDENIDEGSPLLPSSTDANVNEPSDDKIQTVSGTLIDDETAQEGKVSWSNYLNYIQSFGMIAFSFSVLLYGMTQLLLSGIYA